MRRVDFFVLCEAPRAGEGGGALARAQRLAFAEQSRALEVRVQNHRQPPPSPPRFEQAPTPLTLIYALSCRSGSRSFFDADAVPPMPQPARMLGCSRGRSGARCRRVFRRDIVWGPGASRRKNWPGPVAVGPSLVARGRI